MGSAVTRVESADQPLAWHYYSDLDEAIEAVKAADMLDLPFILHRREEHDPDAPGDTETVSISYVVVVLPPGAEVKANGDDET